MNERKVGELILNNIKSREVEKIDIIHFITDVLYMIDRGVVDVPHDVSRAITRLRRKYLLLSDEHSSNQSSLSIEGNAIELIESLISDDDSTLDKNMLTVIKENYNIERKEYLAQLECKEQDGLMTRVKKACKKITSHQATKPPSPELD